MFKESHRPVFKQPDKAAYHDMRLYVLPHRTRPRLHQAPSLRAGFGAAIQACTGCGSGPTVPGLPRRKRSPQ